MSASFPTHPLKQSLVGHPLQSLNSLGAAGAGSAGFRCYGRWRQDYNWVSGRATSVLIDPADTSGNTVLLGGAYGGLWRSTNAGSLSPIQSRLRSLAGFD
jgi:hypothetical protein